MVHVIVEDKRDHGGTLWFSVLVDVGIQRTCAIGVYAVRPRICLVEGTTGYDPSLDSVDVAVPVKSDPACGRSRKKCAGRDSDKSAGCVSITSRHIGQRTLGSMRRQGHGYEQGEANAS